MVLNAFVRDGSLLSMARKQSYFQVIANAGYFFAIILVGVFFGIAWLSNKGHISAETGVNCIALYWIASVAYVFFGMCREFRRPYKLFIERMRLNWRFEWIALVYVLGTLFCSAPLLYFLSAGGFYEAMSGSFKSYSVRGLMASYGASMFYSMIVMSMIVQIVAARRGMRCFKQSSADTRKKLAYIKSIVS